FDVSAKGHAEIFLPGLLGVLGTIEGDRVRVDVPFPTVVRAGVRVRPVPRLGVELAGVFEQWSRLQFIRVTPDIIVRAPTLGIDELALPVIELPKKQRDVFNL